jgi:hydroxypyruvate isomerase
VLFSRTEDSAFVVEAVGAPNVRLLYDLYHSVVEGEDPREVVPRVRHLLGHVQVADAPGRGEPGSGTIDWLASLALLRDAGYTGTVGVECHPSKQPTAAALQYIRDLCAQ